MRVSLAHWGLATEKLLDIAIDEAPPALQVKGLPIALELREPVGDRIERSRVRPKAEMARIDNDILRQFPARLDAAAPGHDSVVRAPDRRRRHRRGRPE